MGYTRYFPFRLLICRHGSHFSFVHQISTIIGYFRSQRSLYKEPNALSIAENNRLSNHVDLRCLCYLLSGYGDTVHSRKRLIDLYKTHTNLVITNKNIDTELMFINSGNSPTLPFLQNVSNLLSAKAKQVIVLACYQFALGSSMMEHQDRVRINTIGSSINLSLPEVEYLIVNNPG